MEDITVLAGSPYLQKGFAVIINHCRMFFHNQFIAVIRLVPVGFLQFDQPGIMPAGSGLPFPGKCRPNRTDGMQDQSFANIVALGK